MDPKFLVLSREHHLLPLAHRLRNIEGAPTEVIVWKKSYENAWDGMIEKDLMSSKRELHTDSITKLVERAVAGELIVVHDVPSLASTNAFEEAEHAYCIEPSEGEPSALPVRLGWWNTTEGSGAMHLLVYDMGAWPGGMGRSIPGGVTLIKLEGEGLVFFQAMAKDHYAPSFQGLINVELVEDGGELRFGKYELGWPHLQTQAFMGAVSTDWTHILGFPYAEPLIEKQYTVAQPLSVPPWPTNPSAKVLGRSVKDLPIELNAKLHKHVYWHDVWVDKENKTLFTAGLDGLVGIVHASADTFEGARQRALSIAALVGVKEKQFRPDIGHLVQPLLASLEENYGVVV